MNYSAFIFMTPLGWMIHWYAGKNISHVDTYAYRYWEDAHDHLVGKGNRY